ASVMFGSFVAGVIVWTPLPTMLKLIVSAPGFPFALVIASRSEPAPESAVDVTVKVAAGAEAVTRSAARTIDVFMVLLKLERVVQERRHLIAPDGLAGAVVVSAAAPGDALG